MWGTGLGAPQPAARALRAALVSVRDARRMVHVVWSSQQRAVTDYLAVYPDSLDYAGFFAMGPAEFRLTVALHLGAPYGASRSDGQPRPLAGCRCAVPCRQLVDGRMDALLTCTTAPPTALRRHDCWVAGAWAPFCAAYGLTHDVDVGSASGLRRELRAQGRPTPDVCAFVPTLQQWVWADAVIAHPCPTSRHAFGEPSTWARRQEELKRRWYRARRRPRDPPLYPLLGSTLGVLGRAAWCFFDAVVRGQSHSAAAGSSLAFLDLRPDQQSLLWRRRVSVFLRRSVASAVLDRLSSAVRAAAGPSACRCCAWARSVVAASVRGVPGPGAAFADVVGTGFGRPTH